MSYRGVLATQLGLIAVEVDEQGAVTRIGLGSAVWPALGRERSDVRRCTPVFRQLSEYLDGSRRYFKLAVAPTGSEFQLRVWDEVSRIPYGTTLSYGEIARRLGDIALARAVGAANGSNPIPILIPCHRVIGADGSLVGYGGGLEIKRRLLDLEAGVMAGRQIDLEFD